MAPSSPTARDAPVEDINPIASYYASVSRRTKDGTVFFPDQRMSRMGAEVAHHQRRVCVVRREDRARSEVGKLADVTVFSKNILTVPEADIPTTKILYTIVGGQVAYEGK